MSDSGTPRTTGDSITQRSVSRGLGALISSATLGVIVVLWWLVTSGTGIVKPLFFPSPEEVIQSLGSLQFHLVQDAFATLVRVIVSWAIGSALGVVVGLLMVRSRLAYYVLTPVVEGLRPVPPVALIPFMILWFGIGDMGKLCLAGIGCFMVMVIQTTTASGNVPPVYVRAARSLGASPNQVYRTVILPAIVPTLVGGLRIGAALAFGVVVAAEFMGAEQGIGALIMLASRTLNTPVILLGTIIIGLEAYAVERAIRFVSLRLTSWAERSTD